MKKLSIVVHKSLQQELADYLRSQQLNNFMFSHIEEHSSQTEKDALLSARDKVVGYVPQVRVDVLLSDGDVVLLLKDIKNSDCAFTGQGQYWVSDISEFGEI